MHHITRTLVIAGAAGASLFGGVALSAAASGAQESDTTDTTETTAEGEVAEPGADVEVDGECQPGEGRRHRGPNLEVAAEAIGIEADALHDAIEGGSTIAQVAEENGVDPQVVVDALLADVEAHLAEEVAAGDLTQEEADERLARATERIPEAVENGRPEHGERPERPADAPADDAGEPTGS